MFAALRAASRIILIAGGLLVLGATGLIVVEVIMRQVFGATLGGVEELAGYALAIGSSWSFAATLLDKANVRIDTAYVRFGPGLRAACDVVALWSTVGFGALLAYYAVEVFKLSAQFGTTSQGAMAVRIAWPQALWAAGLVWFVVVAVVLAVATSRALLKRDWRTVERLAGAHAIEDELAGELRDADRRGRAGASR